MEQGRQVHATYTLAIDFNDSGSNNYLSIWIRFVPCWKQALLLNVSDRKIWERTRMGETVNETVRPIDAESFGTVDDILPDPFGLNKSIVADQLCFERFCSLAWIFLLNCSQ